LSVRRSAAVIRPQPPFYRRCWSRLNCTQGDLRRLTTCTLPIERFSSICLACFRCWSNCVPPRLGPSISGAPTGDIEDCAGRETALVAQQPADHRNDLRHLAKAVHGNFCFHEVNLALGHLLKERRDEDGRRDGVHHHTTGGQLLRE